MKFNLSMLKCNQNNLLPVKRDRLQEVLKTHNPYSKFSVIHVSPMSYVIPRELLVQNDGRSLSRKN